MRAAIYARYSSENQRESSIEDQVRLCREEAARHGFTVVHAWSDPETSGQLKERPGLQAMLTAAERGEFDVLLIDDTSRLSRDTSDALHLLKQLQFWSIRLIARADSLDTHAGAGSARLLYSIKSVIGEEYLRGLALTTHRGQEGAVRRGYHAGGCPYGYRSRVIIAGDGQTLGAQLEVHSLEAEVVSRIFRLRVGDGEHRALSLREVVIRLNTDRIPPPGQRWRNRTKRQCATWSCFAVRTILINPIYTGKVIWNRTRMVRHPDTRRRLRRARPESEWVTRQDEALRIVSDELWDAAQRRALAARLGANIPKYRLYNRAKYLLSGFVRCACGSHFVISNKTSYRCAASRNRGPMACTNQIPISRRRLERAVVDALRTYLYTPQTLAPLLAEIRTALLRKAEEYRQRERLDAEMTSVAQLNTEIENIKTAIAMGKATTTLLEMLEEREAKRKALQPHRSPATGTEERLGRALDRLPALVERVIADLHAVLAEQHVDRGKELLAALVEGITLYPTPRGLEAEIRGTWRPSSN